MADHRPRTPPPDRRAAAWRIGGDRRGRRLEDVVIIFGAGEMYQLREALEELLGDAVDRPDTPARSNAPWRCYLSLRGAPGTPTVLRRPALLTTPESWEIHIDGTDRATSRAVRAAGRTGFFSS